MAFLIADTADDDAPFVVLLAVESLDDMYMIATHNNFGFDKIVNVRHFEKWDLEVTDIGRLGHP